MFLFNENWFHPENVFVDILLLHRRWHCFKDKEMMKLSGENIFICLIDQFSSMSIRSRDNCDDRHFSLLRRWGVKKWNTSIFSSLALISFLFFNNELIMLVVFIDWLTKRIVLWDSFLVFSGEISLRFVVDLMRWRMKETNVYRFISLRSIDIEQMKWENFEERNMGICDQYSKDLLYSRWRVMNWMMNGHFHLDEKFPWFIQHLNFFEQLNIIEIRWRWTMRELLKKTMDMFRSNKWS